VAHKSSPVAIYGSHMDAHRIYDLTVIRCWTIFDATAKIWKHM